MISKSIFKSYDVRGIYPSELNDQAAFAIGKAFVAHTGAKNLVIAYDARLSSPSLQNALAAGILAAGAKVTTIGQLPTECLYFAVAQYSFDAGIMVTASHNPKDYNGFKMLVRKNNDIEWVRGKDLLETVIEEPFNGEKADVEVKEILPDYIAFMAKFLPANPKPLRIVVDASNGVMGTVIGQIKHSLPIEIIELNFQPDGNFPNHSPNPLDKGASDQIAEAIAENHADFGIMFDGDADRIFLVDERGQLILGDATLLLLAKYFLQKNPGMGIAYNAFCSRAVAEFVTKWGGAPLRTAVGFVNVREGLINNNGVMGGETSCHYCFKEYFYCDSGMIAFLTLLQIISQDGRPVSEVMQELSPYKKIEVNFQVEDTVSILEKIKEKYKDGQQDFLDGITVQYKDWWFVARSSNTEPLLKLMVEANTQELLEEKKKELVRVIK